MDSENEDNFDFDDDEEQVNETDQKTNEPTTSRVEPVKKRIVRNPMPKLNVDRLRGPKGLVVLKDVFKDIHFEGKGHEKEDIDSVMSHLEQWTHRLFPKFTFDDALTRIEKLGHKSEIANYVKRIRLDLLDEVEKETNSTATNDTSDPVDSFDALLNQADRDDVITSQPIVQSTLTDEQRERMVRNRLLAEERRLARQKVRTEQVVGDT